MTDQTLLVTGGTGLVGSNIIQIARARGYRVKALVRSLSELEPLQKLGVEFALGDVTDPDSLVAAANKVDGIIHCAATVGGTWATAKPEEFHNINYQGVVNVFEAASRNEVRRTVHVSSCSTLDNQFTMTETSPIAPIKDTDSPYTRAKRASYYEGMRRASLGQDILFVTPAAIYGHALFVDRAFAPTSFNSTLLNALTGQFKRYADFPFCWVYVDDVAEIAMRAFEKGRRGARYMTAGVGEEARSVAGFCNMGCELAGVPFRVEDLGLEAVSEEIGSVRHLAERKYVFPMADPKGTTAELGYPPTPLSIGIPKTLAWFKEIGKFPLA